MQWRVQMDPDDEVANVAGDSGEDSEVRFAMRNALGKLQCVMCVAMRAACGMRDA